MYKSSPSNISKGESMQFRERPGQEQLQKPSLSRTFSNYSKKLILGTIFTSLVFTSVGCAAGRKSIKSETIVTQLSTSTVQAPKIVSAETTIKDKGSLYYFKIETKDNEDFVKVYVDGSPFSNISIEDEINKHLSGKFTNREIIMGNPSMMIKGIDGKGNYGYLLFDKLHGKILVTPIISGFNVKILKKLGVEVNCIFDEKAKTWRILYIRDGEEKAYSILTENGKKLSSDEQEEEFGKQLKKEYTTKFK